MKAFDVAELARGVPEIWGSEPLVVKREGRVIGIFYPLRACRRLSERTRRELWTALFGAKGSTRNPDGMSDEEITRDLEAAGREAGP